MVTSLVDTRPSFLQRLGAESDVRREPNAYERTSEIRSLLKGGFGKASVKGRDERKERALDTGLPKQTFPYALFTAKDLKKSLDKADAVIPGAPQFRLFQPIGTCATRLNVKVSQLG